jgi:mono/diheme cytochrome c family protein
MTRAILLSCCSAMALAVVACATAPGAGHVDRGPALVERGRELYKSRCASCHRLYAPSGRTRDQWAAALERMAPRAHLSGGEREAIRRYLAANASDPEAPAAAP